MIIFFDHSMFRNENLGKQITLSNKFNIQNLVIKVMLLIVIQASSAKSRIVLASAHVKVRIWGDLMLECLDITRVR